MPYKIIREISDGISLIGTEGRNNLNNVDYDLDSVARAVDKLQQWIEKGIVWGFLHHTARDAKFAEQKHAYLTREECTPAFRTSALSYSNGILRFTQQIFDTEPGRLVDQLEKNYIGGWSWVVGMEETREVVTSIYGFDYVWKPGFVSLKLVEELKVDGYPDL